MLCFLIVSFLVISGQFAEIQINDCENIMRHWEFVCLEMYSPYLCRHFLNDNMSVLNKMLSAKFGASVNCVQ